MKYPVRVWGVSCSVKSWGFVYLFCFILINIEMLYIFAFLQRYNLVTRFGDFVKTRLYSGGLT